MEIDSTEKEGVDWQEQHEMFEMGNAGWGDLRMLVDGTYKERAGETPADYVREAFGLIADGHGYHEDALAEHRTAFLNALKAGPERNAKLLEAMAKMDGALHFVAAA